MDLLIRIAQGILCIATIVMIHEVGHLLAARIFGIRIQKFSIFLAPWFSIARWKPGRYLKFFVSKAQGDVLMIDNANYDNANFNDIKPRSWKDTEYVFGWLPIAGYCLFDTFFSEKNEDGKDIYPSWDIRNAKPWKRLIVMLAGIIANLLCAFIIFICLFNSSENSQTDMNGENAHVRYSPCAKSIGFEDEDIVISADTNRIVDMVLQHTQITTARTVKVLRQTDTVTISLPVHFNDSIIKEVEKKEFNSYLVYINHLPLVTNIKKGSIADSFGIQKGDFITKIDSVELHSLNLFLTYVINRIDSVTTLTFARKSSDGKKWNYFEKTIKIPLSYPICGMTFAYSKDDFNKTISEAQSHGTSTENQNSIANALDATANIASETATYYISSEDDNEQVDNDAPDGIIGIFYIFPNQWIWPFWWYAVAILSIGIAIFNLLPIPGLDGGQAIFCLLEIVSRHRLNENVMGLINGIGWFIVLGWIIWINIRWLI